MIGQRSVEQVSQTENADCALACLTMIARYHGSDVSLTDLKNRYSSGSRGLNLQAITGFAGDLGFLTRSLRAELDDLDEVREPVILHWNLNHFVVLSGKVGDRFKINDPAAGPRLVSRQEVSDAFTGVLVTLERVQRPLLVGNKRLSVFSMIRQEPGILAALAKVAILSLVVQATVLASPLLLQLVLDRAVPAGNGALLFRIVFVFAALATVQVVATWLRGITLNKTASNLSLHFSAAIASMLMRIESSYFIRRGIGDILSRMLSIAPVRDLLSGRLGSIALDILLVALTTIVLVVYDFELAAIAIGSLVLQVLLQLWMAPKIRDRQSDSLIAKAKEQSLLIESIRGITALKLFNLEANRLSTWYAHLTDATEAEYQISRIRLAADAGVQAITGVELLLLVYIAALALMGGDLTLGQVVAFLAYRQLLVGRMPEIMRFVVDVRVAAVHLDRIADVVVQPEDRTLAMPDYQVPDSIDAIELQDVEFSYTPQDAKILDGLCLTLRAGDHIAIKGVSGSGKSTLVRILLGLLEPDKGSFLVNGMQVTDFGYPNYRQLVAAVLQDDNLFTGSVMQNIAMFDDSVDFIRVQRCAIGAGVHEEIIEMPMAYQTLVSDSGANLSGGQKQRILIARALYRNPQLMVIDEGTANLDVDLERLVNDNVEALEITRIVFAHRPQTLERADRIYELKDGKLLPASMSTTVTEETT